MKKVIFLQRIGTIDQMILLNLKKDLKNYFKEYIKLVQYSDTSLPLDETLYNTTEKKYDGSEILRRLSNFHKINDFLSILGLIDKDIKSKRRKYVYGMARTNKKTSSTSAGFSNEPGVAIVSVFRLRENFYSRSENTPLFRRRVLKIAIHELGHSLGIKKCKNECIMQCKRSLAGVDEKTLNFCDKCRNYLRTLFF